MSLGIHLPEPLVSKLDAYAAALAKRRSSVVREAVSAYLLHRAVTVWLTELAQRTSPAEAAETAETSEQPKASDWPDMVDAIRAEANANMKRHHSRFSRAVFTQHRHTLCLGTPH